MHTGGPVAKTSPSNTGSAGWILGRGTKIPHVSRPKNQNINNRNNIVTDSIKTLKRSTYKHAFKNMFHHSPNFSSPLICTELFRIPQMEHFLSLFHNSTMFPMPPKPKIKCLFFQILPPNPFLWLILNEEVIWGRGIIAT